MGWDGVWYVGGSVGGGGGGGGCCCCGAVGELGVCESSAPRAWSVCVCGCGNRTRIYVWFVSLFASVAGVESC